MRLLYVSNIPSPYQLELYSHIAASGLAQVRALFCTWTYPGRGWKKPELPLGFEVLPHCSFQRLLPDLVLSFGIKKRIREFRPDVAIVGSYMVPGLHRAMSVLTKMGVPWLFWEEFHYILSKGLKRMIRERLLMGALRRCSAVLAIGKRAQRFFEELTEGKKPVHNFPYASDLSRFMNEPRRTDPNKMRFLFSGQLIPRKGVDVLIRAFAEVAAKHERAELVLIGDGLLRTELEAMVPHELRGRVQFKGNVQWAELPRHYSEADVLAFPSRHDGWGMVVPEAMAAGMPVISTREVGSALDLVEDGKTGFLFNKDAADALARHMSFFCEKPEEAARMGALARKACQHVDISNAAPSLVEILNGYSGGTA